MTAPQIGRRFTPDDRADSTWHYLDFAVPPGCGGFTVTTSCSRSDAVIDLGCLGPQGWRGWSGAARTWFAISDSEATPGYLPGVVDGTWKVVIGLHRVPAPGVDLSVEVRLTPTPMPPTPPAPPAPARPPRPDLPTVDGMTWLAGDLHCHTVHSDGADPIEAVAALAVSAGLDFLAVTDHNTTSHHRFLPSIGARYGLDLLPGQELTTWRGHANVLGDIGWVDFREPADAWIREVADRGGLLSVNHPVCGDCAWRQPIAQPPPLLETWHSSWLDRADGAPLAFRQAFAPTSVPVGGADYHRAGSGGLPGHPTTWVLAADGDVWGGLTAGRTAISAGPGAPLLLRLGDDLLAVGADGLLLTTPDGNRQPVRSDRQILPAVTGFGWLEDSRSAVQAITA
jgi:hypothetical protein